MHAYSPSSIVRPSVNGSGTGWHHSPDARRWQAPPLDGSPQQFHRSLAAYEPTPLVELPRLAGQLGVRRVFVKDESTRLGLPAFKILGASYAVAKELARRAGVEHLLPLAEIGALLKDDDLSLSAATDGNHGRAVARVAAMLGLPATIYVPVGVSAEAQEAIVEEGATLVELDLSYDDVVRYAADAATANSVLIQDTSWPGYEDIPQWIVDGYDTMLAEVDNQLRAHGETSPSLIVAPAGVGSFAQAVVSHYRRTEVRPAVLAAEPSTAASVTSALTHGRVVTVPTGDTVMTGLNCGTVSEIAWSVLRDGLDAAATVSDEDALRAAADLAALGVDSGPCGAATLAAARLVTANPKRRAALGLGPDSTVVLLSTEGRAANPKGL